ncbi:MAG: dephospho-CoA kinase [Candidatus Omnitrophica bacterium]|nr:dephospho-CoA kinase [Candidatus Omnitrophota bacterium]
MKKQNKIILGLTGGLGSGKTTVARIFKSLGAQVIDADKLAHACLKKGSNVYQKIISVFGTRILLSNSNIDRKKLGSIVFNNCKMLRKLNSIIHPEVIRMMTDDISSSRARVVVLDVPLLIEAGLEKIADKIVVVNASRANQVERVFRKSKIKREEILKRIRCQMPLSKKAKLADFVIDNNGGLKETRRQVKQIWRRMWKS